MPTFVLGLGYRLMEVIFVSDSLSIQCCNWFDRRSYYGDGF